MPMALKIGLGLLTVGVAPLLAIELAAEIGLLSDPNPNPIGLGLFFAAMTVPSMALIAFGVIQWLWRRM